MEQQTIAGDVRSQAEEFTAADLVIGMPVYHTAESIQAAANLAWTALARLEGTPKAVLVHPAGVMLDAGDWDAERLRLLPSAAPALDWVHNGLHDSIEAYRTVFGISKKMGARACCLLGSEKDGLSAEALQRLIEPPLEQKFDLVAPYYLRHRFDGLINSSIVYPLTRALYGKRLRYPIGLDYGFSGRLVDYTLNTLSSNVPLQHSSPLLWIVTEAMCGGFEVCQAHLGLRLQATAASVEVSALLTQVLGPIFLDMERQAAVWQKVRGSQPVSTLGGPSRPAPDSATVDVRPMVDSFQLGLRNLREVWGLVLPPASLLELKKLTRLAPEQFRMPDELWAKIVYDFALAHRLRVMNRDHLLGAMTPLYLAWVASYAVEAQATPAPVTEARIERLCLTFEAQKPYLLSRWRWPDRFNP